MSDIAGWVAPVATMLAAILTAANLGTRVTGWGFVIFTVGAIAWSIEALLTHQQNLLWSNAFLAVVDAIGIYRWLGHRAKLEDGAKSAASKSEPTRNPLFPVLSIEGSPILGKDGSTVGRIVGAMAECGSGRFVYLVVQLGTVTGGGSLRSIQWKDVEAGETFRTRLSKETLAASPEVDAADWPALPKQAGKRSGGPAATA